MSSSALIILLACNVMWSVTYSFAKIMMSHGFEPLEVAFLRFFAGAVALSAYCMWDKPSRKALLGWIRDIGVIDTRILAVGLLTFFVSPLCQMTGLKLSRAIDGALIIAIEPLVSIIAACLILREELKRRQIFAILLALAGAAILTELTWQKLMSFADARLTGNLIFLVSLFSETAYSVVAKPALSRRPPVVFVTVAVWIGVAALGLYNVTVYGPSRMAGLAVLFDGMRWADWASVLYLGVGCTAFGYLYWMKLVETVPVSVLALTLYIQPILGMLWGGIWLGESVNVATLAGAGLILIAVWLATRNPRPRPRSHPRTAS